MKSTKIHNHFGSFACLVSRGNERQAKEPMFEALYLSCGILTNVSQIVEIQLQSEVVRCYIKLMNKRIHFLHLSFSFMIEELVPSVGFIRNFLGDHVPDEYSKFSGGRRYCRGSSFSECDSLKEI